MCFLQQQLLPARDTRTRARPWVVNVAAKLRERIFPLRICAPLASDFFFSFFLVTLFDERGRVR